ncbi:MAG: hypothetical protein VYC55_07825 [Pseudomonadota bacterium]|nr:hypothetical protein [Pseudomonadota bacterium]
MNKKLARITKAGLEIKQRGILNFWIHVNYEDGFSQGVGGLALDEYNKNTKQRQGTAYGCEIIRRILIALGVNNLHEAEGVILYVIGEGDGLNFKPKGIARLDLDGGKSVIFDEVASQFVDNGES